MAKVSRKAKKDLAQCRRLGWMLADEPEEGGAYLCGPCARERGGTWPPGHCATFHGGVCPYCGKQASLCAVDDYNWPHKSYRPRGYGGGRD